MPSTTYVADFLKPWGRLQYDSEALNHPIPEHLIDVVYAAAIAETYTVVEARKAQVLGLFKYEDLATFLPVWEAEESEHGRVLMQLTRLDEVRSSELVQIARLEGLRNWLVNKGLVAARFVPGIDIVFCVTGVIAEYHTVTLYQKLARDSIETSHRELFLSLARQEGRHLRFYMAASKVRTASANALQNQCAKLLMKYFWMPVGMDCLGAAGWNRCFSVMLGDPDLVEKLGGSDDLLDEIPRMAGLRLMRRFLERNHKKPEVSGHVRAG